ncbi:hypothetical protein HDV06_004837 [Boothiomyces sp. JEL0866]|nr:hypothetical protein HDV06_004837 [Boothiomyces sp. JEL0866]
MSDCTTFVEAFAEMGGVNATLNSSNCCTWDPKIVYCRPDNNQVAKIFLDGSVFNLQGSISTKLEQLSSLQVLEIINTKLTGSIPAFPQTFTTLVLSNNRLTGQIPFIHFYNKTDSSAPITFSLDGNNLSGTIPIEYENVQFSTCPFPSNLCAKFVPACANNVCSTVENGVFVPTPTPSASNTPQDSSSSHIGIGLIGAVIGGLLFVVGCVGYLYYSRKKIAPSFKGPVDFQEPDPLPYLEPVKPRLDIYQNLAKENDSYYAIPEVARKATIRMKDIPIPGDD